MNNFFKKKPGTEDGLKILAEKNKPNSQTNMKDIFNGFSSYNDKNVPVSNYQMTD